MTRLLRFSRFIGCALAVAIGVAPAVAQSQGAVLTGRVVSDQGQPVSEANVYITEMNVSVATNQAGNYTITIPAARLRAQPIMLRVRAIGFLPSSQQVTLRGGTQTVNFQVRRDISQLGQVVVTGVTAATQQIKLPFTVTRVDSTLMPVAGSNPITQLQGKVPGALIVNASGRPGAAPSVVLGGPTSLNATGRSQQPLYLLDGVPIQGGLPDINPNDVESVEIVKGAAAASIYGARAGSGVINITTKSGRTAPQGIRFGIRTELGNGGIERQFPLSRASALALSPDGQLFCTKEVAGGSPCARYINWDSEVARINNDGLDYSLPPQAFLRDFGIASAPNYDQLTGLYQVTQWPTVRDPVAQLVTSSAYANTNIDMRGKVNKTGVYASLSNFVQQGALQYAGGFVRNSARVNVDQSFSDRLSGSINSYYSTTIDHASQLDETGSSGPWFTITRAPYMSNMQTRDNLGRIVVRQNPLSQGDQNGNPLYAAANNHREDRGTRFVGGGTLRYTPIDWLNLDGNFGYDRSAGNYTQIRDKGWRTTSASPSTSAGYLANGNFDNQSFTGTLNAAARHTFFNDLVSTLTTRYVYTDQTIRGQDESGTDLVLSGLETLDAATNNPSVSSSVQAIRDMGFFVGTDFEYKDRYILGGLVRRDASSLFGAGHRWSTFGRASAAWIASREPWWPAPNALSLFKLRASEGTTGQRPRFSAQYATFTIGTSANGLGTGTLNPSTLGNPNLRPEVNREIELGTDLEFFRRYGLNVSYSKAVINDQILPVKLPTATGYQTQWQNAGEITNKSWEGTLTVPIIRRGSLNWTSRLIYNRTRSVISRLDVPEFTGSVTAGNTFDVFKFRTGEKIGTMYGFDYVHSCSQLPAPFGSDCGAAGSSFQKNDQGFIVWTGAGNQLTEGITKNLWRTQLARGAGPWGDATNWGMPITLRDSTSSIAFVPVGNGLPKYQWGLSQSLDYKRFSFYGLLDAIQGRQLWNIQYHWSLGDLQSGEVNQTGKSVETAKPIGYYWRRGPSNSPGGSSGVGGLYDALGPSTYTVEDASFVKLRELSVNYRLGAVGGRGDWKVGFVGHNLKTWTDFRGFDPEAGSSTGPLNSSALTGVAGYRFPNLRSYTLQLSTSF